MSVAECKATVDAEEFAHWQCLDREQRLDYQQYYLAQIAAVIANANKGKDTEPYCIGDFLLHKKEEEVSEEEKQERIAKSLIRWAQAARAVGEANGSSR